MIHIATVENGNAFIETHIFDNAVCITSLIDNVNDGKLIMIDKEKNKLIACCNDMGLTIEEPKV